MKIPLSENIWNILTCPYCGHILDKTPEGAACRNCRALYRYSDSGALDLRLQQKKRYTHEYEIGSPLLIKPGLKFGVLKKNENPEVDFNGCEVPSHLSRERLSYFPKAKREGSIVLDLGCGNVNHRKVCEHAGFEYVGFDYWSGGAQILGDAHALPFKDESFDFIISFALLEHIRFPFVMMREAHRVLHRGGVFIGTVAFLEPFHGGSFYHHTHLGTLNSLLEGGFKVEHIAPNEKWSVLIAQANMGLFPKMPGLLSKTLIMPIEILHRIWWKISDIVSNKNTNEFRIRNTTGAFTFIARR
ncbi:MAG: class I SAM-dependent methyltransferase [Bacteroidota bacterium]